MSESCLYLLHKRPPSLGIQESNETRMLSVKVFKGLGSNSFNCGQHVPVMNIISSYICEPIEQLCQLFEGWEENEDGPPAQNSYFSLDLQAGEMNAVMVALGWLNDRDLCRICADLPAQDGKDLFEMTLEHLKKWRWDPAVSAKRKFGLLTDPETRMQVAIKKAFAFHKRWPRDESKRIIRVLSLMLLHRRGNRFPGHQFPKFSLELFDIYIDMFDDLLETDPNFDEIRSKMFSPPTVPGYMIQKLP